jgi:hypothetical protein
VEVRREKGPAAAREEARGGQDRDRVRPILARMEEDEERVLEARTARAERLARRSVGSVVAVSAVVLVVHLLHGMARERRRTRVG